MNHSMFAEQDDFARRTDEPFFVLWPHLTSVQGKLLYSTAESILVGRAYTNIFVQIRVESYCTCFQEGVLEILEKIVGILYTNT